MAIATINPATGELERSFDAMSESEINQRLARAAAAFSTYRTTGIAERAAILGAIATILDIERDEIAALITTEMGKPLAEAQGEVAKCAVTFRYYAQHGPAFLAAEPADAAAVKAERAEVRYQPLGPILAVMPWNFPWFQVTRFAAPALMAGNVGLLKHASNVPQTALMIEQVFRRAGVPDGAFQALLAGSDAVESLLRDQRVVAATCTGSAAAGAAVASIAGSAGKKAVLELGGSDPFVVLASADLEQAVRVGVRARCQNNGQSCIAAKRFIVHDAIADEFERRFVQAMEALPVGDPMDPVTRIGPLATQAGRRQVEEQVADARDRGAAIACGGEAPDRPGWYYPPTVITGITPQMRIFSEEVFAPVAQLYRVGSLDEAIALANATDFGLGSNIWTRDPAEQERFIAEVQAGMVFVNGMTTSYPEVPFGGVKASGYGRELAAQGLREFCNLKTVWIRD